MGKTVRLLCIVGGMNVGGAETFLMKLLRKADRSRLALDFLTFAPGCYEDEITSLGGKVFHAVPKTKGPIRSFLSIRDIVRASGYDAVLRISQSSVSSIDLLAARMGGAKFRGFRSSNTNACGGRMSSFLHTLFRPFLRHVSNVWIAPGAEAAGFMFGERAWQSGKVHLLRNGIDLDAYSFDLVARESIRKELGVGPRERLLGMVGRFERQKNHAFALRSFRQLVEKDEAARLVLVGDGSLRQQILESAADLIEKGRLVYLGIRTDIAKLYSAFDLLWLPSNFEGFPNVVVEAQASGLPCLVSDCVTRDTAITNLVRFAPLIEAEWADLSSGMECRERELTSLEGTRILGESGYSIESDIDELIRLFEPAGVTCK